MKAITLLRYKTNSVQRGNCWKRMQLLIHAYKFNLNADSITVKNKLLAKITIDIILY